MRIRILLVDDHALFRQALRLLLATESDIEVVGELGDGAQIEAAVARWAPDVIVMDIGMPGVNGIEATRSLLARDPRQRVLVLSAYGASAFVSEVMRAGALGYVLKSSSADALVEAIRAVASGEPYCCPAINAALEAGGVDVAPARAHRDLGEREKQVLCLLAGGLSSPQIALALKIASSTVDVHRRNIMGKLGLHSVAELTHYAIRTGMITI